MDASKVSKEQLDALIAAAQPLCQPHNPFDQVCNVALLAAGFMLQAMRREMFPED